MAFGHFLLGSYNFRDCGPWSVCEVALSDLLQEFLRVIDLSRAHASR